VVVTDHALATPRLKRIVILVFMSLLLTLFNGQSNAVVLPEDRADALYHVYDGGGVEVTGPAFLVRKDMKNKVSVYSSYYADNISSASIDVVTTASPYNEQRDEFGLGLDTIYGTALFNISASYSDESDYKAKTLDMNISQDIFGGMTTINLGFTRGWDDVGRVDNNFDEEIDRYRYRLNLSQIVSSTIILNINYEAISDKGFLNNPYRSARLLGASVPERYPGTRTSNAVAFRGIKSISDNISAQVGYRYFWDTWSISAHTIEIAYNQQVKTRWLAEARYHYYNQDKASFYADNFQQELNYMARDKELSSYSSHAVGFKISYTLLEKHPLRMIQESTVNFSYDFIYYEYDDFTDVRDGKLYSYNANVFQLMLSIWY